MNNVKSPPIVKPPLTLNKFKFTVHTEQNEFQEKLFNFIEKQNMVEDKDKTNTKVKFYRYKLNKNDVIKISSVYQNDDYIADLKDKGSLFFSLKISNKYDYTFSFENIAQLTNFNFPKGLVGEKLNIAYAYDEIYSSESLIFERTNILKKCLKFIGDQNLKPNTKIKTIGFSVTFDEESESPRIIKYTNVFGYGQVVYNDADSLAFDTKTLLRLSSKFNTTDNKLQEYPRINIVKKHNYDEGYEKVDYIVPQNIPINYDNIKLIKFNTDKDKLINGKKKGVYTYWNYSKSKDIYTSKINYYKADIKYPQEIISGFEKLTSKEIILELHKVMVRRFKACNEVIVQKGSYDRYYVKLNIDCTCKIDKPIKITEKNHLVFKLDIDSKSDYFKISHTSENSMLQQLYRSKKVLTENKERALTKEDIEIYKVEHVECLSYEKEIEKYENEILKIITRFEDKKKDLKKPIRIVGNNMEGQMSTIGISHIEYLLKIFIDFPKKGWSEFFSEFEKDINSSLPILELELEEKIGILRKDIKMYFIDLLDIAKKSIPKMDENTKKLYIAKNNMLPSDIKKDMDFLVKKVDIKYAKDHFFNFKTKEQLVFSFEVNRWDTKHKRTLEKYDDKKKHYFTLDDDIQDIAKHVINFTSKYKLLEIKDKAILEQVLDTTTENFKTKKKFIENVIEDSNTQELMKLNETTLTTFLAKSLEL
ncbi:hypothetical protein HUE87_03570 [Candidatus Sulfurimonas marisnigri]|uniref:Uncharacterized protein n=1 Tax=Candidatus Sulfurimonas marisnigri TaxID=2740405 RepID=A0A7S7M1K5_9BACT|nr:hypothetical protein [Candidatus Sulfurimonas marisnigri]QOY55328.1 hypothetical protein HUE87_03570 [Candidatus Sulfurimonas marisnigri]